MNKKDQAVENFKNGLNCAQTVLAAFCDDLAFDRSAALSVTAGFGSGMGRLQQTCGAVTGAFMAIGVYNSKKYDSNADRKAKSTEMVQAFNKAFIAAHKTTSCRELLNYDISTDEGLRVARENNLFGTVCVKCIKDAIDICESLIK
jgi:C_GCAxxG_C_C family probable redox protein